MTNDELRALRETDWRAFVAACTPERVIALLDENEREQAQADRLTTSNTVLRISLRESEAECDRLRKALTFINATANRSRGSTMPPLEEIRRASNAALADAAPGGAE